MFFILRRVLLLLCDSRLNFAEIVESFCFPEDLLGFKSSSPVVIPLDSLLASLCHIPVHVPALRTIGGWVPKILQDLKFYFHSSLYGLVSIHVPSRGRAGVIGRDVRSEVSCRGGQFVVEYWCHGYSTARTVRETWVWILALPLNSCVTPGKSLLLSEPQSLYLWKEVDSSSCPRNMGIDEGKLSWKSTKKNSPL